MEIISNFLIISIYISFTYTLIWRLWFIYFNIIKNISLSQIAWQQYIHNEAGRNNWYISEDTKKKWGNPSWVQKFMLILIFSNVILLAISLMFSNLIFFVFRVIIIIIPWIGIIWIYNRIPTYHDDIGIAKEIKYIMFGYFMMGICFICLVVAISIVTSSSSSQNDNDILFDILYNLSCHAVAFSAFGTAMIMTYWPLKKFVVLSGDNSGQMRGLYAGIGNDSPRKGIIYNL